MTPSPQIINELSTPEPSQDTSPPKNIYEELFKKWIPEDGTAILKAICAVGDEIRALRIVQEKMLEFNREAAEVNQDLHRESLELEQQAEERRAKQNDVSLSGFADMMTKQLDKAAAPKPAPTSILESAASCLCVAARTYPNGSLAIEDESTGTVVLVATNPDTVEELRQYIALKGSPKQ